MSKSWFYPKGKFINAGKFGSVFNVTNNPKLVIKEIDLKKTALEPEKAQKGAKILFQLNHPNIVHQVDYFFEDIYFYSVMEKIEGEDLEYFIEKAKKENLVIPESFILHVLEQFVSVLKYMYRKEIIHRNLKPANIMLLNGSETIKLVDFGFSRSLSPKGLAESYLGSPLYMSPQVLNGLQYSFESEIWSIGVIIYELIMLEWPFCGYSLEELKDKITLGKFPSITRNISPKLVKSVKAMLKVDPKKRVTLKQLQRFFHFNIPDNEYEWTLSQKTGNKIQFSLPNKEILQEGENNYRKIQGLEQEKQYLLNENLKLQKEIQELKKNEENFRNQIKIMENEKQNLIPQLVPCYFFDGFPSLPFEIE